jgi:hypothetical protein
VARSLPERTVDAYLAIAVAARFPDAALWDPTNTPGSWDHTVIAAGKTVLFESKGNEEGDNDIEIELEQLEDYLSRAVAPLVFYLLADPPGWSDFRPPLAPGSPATTWSSFLDWAYVVPSAALAAATGLTGVTRTVRPSGGTFRVAATGVVVPCVPLRQFFDDLERCFWVARHPRQGAPVRPGQPSPAYPDVPIGGPEVLPPGTARRDRGERDTKHRLTAVAVHLPL